MIRQYLSEEFLNEYRNSEPDWGFKSGPNSIGQLTYARTYSRIKPDGGQENWVDTLERVVNGTMTLMERHQREREGSWNEAKARRGAERMFKAFYNMKALPPGRGLWMMGTDYVMERNDGAPLQNCGFISTDHPEDPAYPFAWLMDMSMLGVGVGFDTLGSGQEVFWPVDNYDGRHEVYVIPDSREGWVESVRRLIESYMYEGRALVDFDYSQIRDKGEPIKGFGGVASGPDPLKKLHHRIRLVLGEAAERGFLTSRDIVDIMNMIGACVVAGNVRRSAELALGEVDDEEFLNLKNYEMNPERAEWGWASNNTIVVRDGDTPDYDKIAERIADNGEPGIFYIDNARKYARMGEYNSDDYKVMGTNPCAEQMLEDGELCNLVEVFPSRCDSKEEFLEAIKYAYLYAKTVTLVPTHDERTNEIMRRNRRIGTSASGIVQFLFENDPYVLASWLQDGYDYIMELDKEYSNWLGIEESVRKTTVKPSGTVSLLAGVTPGVHFPVHDYYIRRIRFQQDHSLVPALRAAGYHIEDDLYSDNTVVVEFPVKGSGLPTEREVSIKEKAAVATTMASFWADNAVSCTITFGEHERGDIAKVLKENEDKWKTVSFLPLSDEGAFEQMPYEGITAKRYEEMVEGLTEIDWSEFHGSDGEMELFCTTDKCEIPLLSELEPA